MINNSIWHRLSIGLILGWTTTATLAQALPSAGTSIDVAQAWQQALDHGDLMALVNTYDVAYALSDDEGTVQVDLCRANEDALHDALAINQIGLGLWFPAYQCAELLGQEQIAEQRLQHVEALIQYGLKQYNEEITRAIPVLSEADIWAFIEASGQELLYRYYDEFQDRRHLNMIVSLWDSETKRERLLAFDYLDTMMRLDRDNPYAELPATRNAIVTTMLTQAADYPDIPLGQALALRQAMSKGEASERVAAMATLARQDNVIAAMAFVTACEKAPELECGDQSVDALLPYAEEKWAIPMVLLAGTYARGIIVPKDVDAARALLDLADARLGGSKGRLLFASMALLQIRFDQSWRVVERDLERAAESGDPLATAMVAMVYIREHPDRDLPKKLSKRLMQAAEAGSPLAQSAAALHLIGTGQHLEGYAWMEKAAQSGFSPAQMQLGVALLSGKNVPRDPVRGIKWMKAAATAGNIEAMVMVAHHYLRENDSVANMKQAQGWLQSATLLGHIQATIYLAQLYERGVDGLAGNAKNALTLYRELLKRPDVARSPVATEVRRYLARLLITGEAGETDPEQAERLLLADANAGDVAAQSELARFYLGNDDATKHAAGLDWLNKAVDGKNYLAKQFLAQMYWFGFRIPADKAKATAIWDEMIAKGDAAAANNLAWVLCTAPDTKDRNGQRGLDALKGFDVDSRGAGMIDTQAACYAAASDFEQAIKTQERAIKSAQTSGGSSTFIDTLQKRLGNYQNEQVTIEALPPMFERKKAQAPDKAEPKTAAEVPELAH